MVKWCSGYEGGLGIRKMWWGIMPAGLLRVLITLIYFPPKWLLLHRLLWKVLCNFSSLGEVCMFLYVCNFVYLGQLLYFVFGKLWEVDSFGCFAWWVGLGIRKPRVPRGGRQQTFCYRAFSFCPYPWWTILLRKTSQSLVISCLSSISCSPAW